jgi:hypothetical protein
MASSVPETIRYFFDQHIPKAVAEGLRQRAVDVLTAQDAGRCSLPDPDQLEFARIEGRVLVSYDPDFLALAASGIEHAGIGWCEATKYGVGQLIHVLLLLHGVLSPDEMKNHVEYL